MGSNAVTGIQTRVFEALSRHAGLEISTSQIATEAGVTISQARGALGHLKTRKNLRIDQIADNIFRYSPGQPKAAPEQRRTEVYGEIGRMRDGTILVQGTDDPTVYKLVDLT